MNNSSQKTLAKTVASLLTLSIILITLVTGMPISETAKAQVSQQQSLTLSAAGTQRTTTNSDHLLEFHEGNVRDSSVRTVANNNYYVDGTRGDDNNPGTIESPLRTISKAVELVGPGDTVLIREGTYRETITMNKSGAADAPITFKAYENERVVVSGAVQVKGWSPVVQGIYQAVVSEKLVVKDENLQVFVNGKMAPQAREPEIADQDNPFSQKWLDTPMIKALAITIQSANGQYLSAINDGGGSVSAAANIAGSSEAFFIIDTNGGKLESGDKVGFLTKDHRHYLAAENGGRPGAAGDLLVANREAMSRWEKFTIAKVPASGEIQSGDVVTLRAFSNGYLSAERVGGSCGGGQVLANRASIGDCEKFTITISSQPLVLFNQDAVELESAGDALAGSYLWGPFGANWSLGMAKITASAPGELAIGETDMWWNSWGWSHGQAAIIGAAGALDSENEWIYRAASDGNGGQLHFKPQAGQDPEDQTIEIRQKTWAVDITGSHIVLSNIDFFAGQLRLIGDHNLLDNVSIKYGTHFVFRETISESNDIQTGNNGAYIKGNDNTVKNSKIAYSAGNGLSVLGDRNVVYNSLIHDFGYMGTYTSGVYFDGTGSKLTRSTLFNSGRDILHVSRCAACEFTYNLLHDSTLLTDDSGVIYAFGRDLKNTEIAYNWIQGVTDPSRANSSIHLGIYLDNGSRNARVHHNLISGLATKPGVGPNTPHEGHLICNNTIIHDKAVDANGNPITFDRIGEGAYCDCNFDKQEKYFVDECKQDTSGNVTGVCVHDSPEYWMDPSRLKVFNTQYFASFNAARQELINPQAILTSKNGWEIIGNPDYRPRNNSSLVDANDAGTACDSLIDEVKGAAPDQGAYENKGTNWIPGYRAVPRTTNGLLGYAPSQFGNAVRLAVQGNYAYVVDWTGSLNVFEISDPYLPALVGSAEFTANEFQDIEVAGDYAYVANDYNGLVRYDISDPSAPFRVDERKDGQGPANSVTLADGQRAFVSYSYSPDNELAIYDLSNFPAANPAIYSPSFTRHRDIYSVDVVGERAYVCASDGYGNVQFQVLNISTLPDSPTLIGSLDLPEERYGYGCEVAVKGKLAYLTTTASSTHDGALLVVSIAAEDFPYLFAEITVPDSHKVPWKYPGIDISGNDVYMMTRNRLCVYDVLDYRNPVAKPCYPFPDSFGDTDGGDVVIKGDLAIVAVAKQDPAGEGDRGGIAIYDISSTNQPLGDPETVLSAGEYHTCALKVDGSVDCWGAELADNDQGQAADQDGPFVQVGAGALHSCGLRPDGSVDCWGIEGWYGQSADHPGPFSQLSVGGAHNCGLSPDGSVTCWGYNKYGQASYQEGPFVQISAGWDQSCGLRPDGAIDCWGWLPEAADQAGPFVQVSAGWSHTCGLAAAGQAICWGDNSRGQAENKAGPFTQISAGGRHTCGLRPDGSVECWGANEDGQAENQSGPYTQISAGGTWMMSDVWGHTCGLRPEGSVDCWGSNGNGQAVDQSGPYEPFDEGKSLPIDLAIAIYKNPMTEEERLPYENIITHFADGIYEATNRARKLSTVTFYPPGSTVGHADIIWVEKCHPSARSSGLHWLHVNMCDIFEDGFGEGRDYNFLDNQKYAGYVIVHEWGHYFFGLYDEYVGIEEWNYDPASPHSKDIAVPNSIMSRVSTVDLNYLNFSLAKNFNESNAQYRVHGASGWDTLSRPASEDPRDGWRVSLPLRTSFPDLKDAAPADDSDASIDLPSTAGRSELDIVWASPISINMANSPLNESPYSAELVSVSGRDITAPEPLLLLAFVHKDLTMKGIAVQGRALLPDGGTAIVNFADDGHPPDAQKDDGLYSAILPYETSGLYTIRADFDNHAGTAALVPTAFNPSAGINGQPVPMPPPQPVSEDFTLSATTEVKVIGVVADDFGDTPAGAQPISPSNRPYSGKIDRPGDRDVFQLTMPAGKAIIIRVSNLALDIQPRLRVLGPDGKKVLFSDSLNDNFLNYLFIPLEGVKAGTTIFAEVSDVSAKDTGGLYELSAGERLPSDATRLYLYLPVAASR